MSAQLLLPARSSAQVPLPQLVAINGRDREVLRNGYSDDIYRASNIMLNACTLNDLREMAVRLEAIAQRLRYTANVHELWNARADIP